MRGQRRPPYDMKGSPIGTLENLAARFWPKVDRSSLLGCWEWTSYRNAMREHDMDAVYIIERTNWRHLEEAA